MLLALAALARGPCGLCDRQPWLCVESAKSAKVLILQAHIHIDQGVPVYPLSLCLPKWGCPVSNLTGMPTARGIPIDPLFLFWPDGFAQPPSYKVFV